MHYYHFPSFLSSSSSFSSSPSSFSSFSVEVSIILDDFPGSLVFIGFSGLLCLLSFCSTDWSYSFSCPLGSSFDSWESSSSSTEILLGFYLVLSLIVGYRSSFEFFFFIGTFLLLTPLVTESDFIINWIGCKLRFILELLTVFLFFFGS